MQSTWYQKLPFIDLYLSHQKFGDRLVFVLYLLLLPEYHILDLWLEREPGSEVIEVGFVVNGIGDPLKILYS